MQKHHDLFFFLSSIHPVEPAGSMMSCGQDMIKYMRFVLNKGQTDTGQRLLDEELFTQSFTGSYITIQGPLKTHI